MRTNNLNKQYKQRDSLWDINTVALFLLDANWLTVHGIALISTLYNKHVYFSQSHQTSNSWCVLYQAKLNGLYLNKSYDHHALKTNYDTDDERNWNVIFAMIF